VLGDGEAVYKEQDKEKNTKPKNKGKESNKKRDYKKMLRSRAADTWGTWGHDRCGAMGRWIRAA